MMSRRRMIMAQSHGGGPAPSIPDNEVWYYAPAQVTLYSSTGVVSHTFSDGKGVLTFANPVTEMKNWLRGISTITDVTMPDTVTSIGTYAFYSCKALALTSLPSGVTSIGSSTFFGCTNLALTSLPSGVTSIGGSTFHSCTKLALTSLPSGVTSIGNSAFQSCTNLALTSLPSGVTSIGNSAFSGCTNLALTSLPSGLTSIGQNAFANCQALAITSLPSGVTSIGQSAFNGCAAIQSLTIDRAEPPTLGSSAFNNTSFPIYVPASAVDTYKAASGWSTYASRIFAIPE